MTWAVLLGALAGTGILMALKGAFPPRIPLADALAALHRPATPAPITAAEDERWSARAGRVLVPALLALGLPNAGLRRDLQVLGRSVERHLAEKAAAGVAGVILPPLLLTLLTAGGVVDGGIVFPIGAAVFLGAALFLAPDADVRSKARARRAEMRHALSVFLDLTVVSLAGGAGVDQALNDAASVPRGWAAGQLRRALATAALTRTAPWEPLARLGEELDVRELQELAATVALAGSEGAKVRASLNSKAVSMRTRQITDAQGAASSATERMTLPLAVLFTGFLLFIGYPAVSAVTTGL
ncbi:type II secretion system F family protein [Embleya sp. NBC_00896]|uniref:type II secretion system F family protein n=1 Tax=Embleya sp. NBC_00896 TaxID=2975961 RepID=UPI002F913AEF|nr:type II secretion system F family protein [Embleya sp. NBC_00896]